MSGSYSQQISATNGMPGCLLVLLDQSYSMCENIGNSSEGKSTAAARCINRFLSNLIILCTDDEETRDYLHIGVVGYGGTPDAAEVLIPGGTAPAGLLTVNELEDRQEVETIEKDGRQIPQTKWFDPVHEDGTPMSKAFDLAKAALEKWVAAYPDSFPPIVMNVTDGQPNDPKKAEKLAEEIRRISTSDGDVLMLSCHISETPGAEILFPTDEATLPDEAAQLLFRMSSELPPTLRQASKDLFNPPPEEGARGFVFNADATLLANFLNIGTQVTQHRSEK